MSAHTLTAICGIAGVLGLAAGAGLLIMAGRAQYERTSLWRWLLEIDLIALLDRRHSIERPIYRHHRAIGATVIAGAVASLVTLSEFSNHPWVTGLLQGILGIWGAWAVILTSWALAVFTLGIGVFLLIRPSALKRIETAANRWIKPFPSSTKTIVRAERSINGLILRAPRFTGLLLIAASLACLLALRGYRLF